MLYIILISVIIIVTPPIFIILRYLDYRKTIIKECSQIYGIELNTIKIKTTMLEEDLTKYPSMNKMIKRIASLELNKYIDIKRLVVNRFRIFDLMPLCKSIELFNEIEGCANKSVIDLFDEVREISQKLTILRAPFRCKINSIKARMQLYIILAIVKCFNKFKDFTRQDIEQVEKDEDFTVDSNLGLLN